VKIKRERLVEIMENAGIDEDRLHVKGYGAFGTTCPGIETDAGLAQLAAFFVAVGDLYAQLTESDDREFINGPDFDPDELTRGVCMDSVGWGLVFFWPDLELED